MSDKENFEEIKIECWNGEIEIYSVEKKVDFKETIFAIGFSNIYTNILHDKYDECEIFIFRKDYSEETLISYWNYYGEVSCFICKNQKEKLECLLKITELCKRNIEINIMLKNQE